MQISQERIEWERDRMTDSWLDSGCRSGFLKDKDNNGR